ncbi:MAG: NAD(P)H-quinone oxidoreductase subunit M, partial [Cyanobacteria bacterium]|nr:NAD(P)H-quinone oxidoreductase subunit M [Cyanobacteriota bacterium]
MSDTPLKCTTRHVRIFAATVDSNGILTAAADQLTLDLDPDSEFEWDESPLAK